VWEQCPYPLLRKKLTLDQIADCPTKPLPGPAIARFHGAISGRSPIGHPPLGGAHGRIGQSLLRPSKFPLLSDIGGLPLSLLSPQSAGGGVTRALPVNGITPNWAPAIP
jgi:hypothetical protein